MRTCPACSFENMNDSRLCGRCGAKLVWDGPIGRDSFQPPRAGWNKFLYPVIYFLAARTPILYNLALAPRRLPSRRVRAAALSIVPGLGHLYLGASGSALKIAAAWFGPLLWVVFLYYSFPGIFLHIAPLFWALLMIIHSVAVVSAASPGLYGRSALETAAIGLILLAMVLALYLGAGYVIQNSLTVRL